MNFAIVTIGVLNALVSAHMLMKYPPPRGYRNNPSYQPIDYDLSSPLPSLRMCKGKPPGAPVATFTAGQVVNVEFEGSARHNGGICQFSLSYDNDQTFHVIQTVEGGCPDANFQWPVQLPSNLPSCDRCTFAWSWINAVGNRELYMNCADVRINGQKSAGRISGKPMSIANFAGFPTIQPAGGSGGPGNSRITHEEINA